MSEIDRLDKMLDNIMDDEHDQAEINFHNYLQTKMQEVIHGVIPSDGAEEKTND